MNPTQAKIIKTVLLSAGLILITKVTVDTLVWVLRLITNWATYTVAELAQLGFAISCIGFTLTVGLWYMNISSGIITEIIKNVKKKL